MKKINNEFKLQLANLHDAFLNASLQFNRMKRCPVEKGLQAFMISDRGRFERTWLSFLYIFVESWQSTQMRDVQNFILSINPESKIQELIKQGEKGGSIKKLQEIRHYMCHRDKRKYWDVGRTAVTNLEYNIKLHEEFSKILLKAMQIYQNLEK